MNTSLPDNSRARRRPAPASRLVGFTLLELLVVVGLIGLLASAVGLALGDRGGNALATAQTTVASLASTARAQAALHQTTAVLAVYARRPPAGDPERSLRMLQVFRDDTPDGARRTWFPVGQPALLPHGVYVVPATVEGLLAPGVTWPSDPPLISSLVALDLEQPSGTPFADAGAAMVLAFASDGTIEQAGPQPHARLVLATAAKTGNVPQFNHPGAVRGILLRPSGAISFVHQAAGF